MEYLLDLGHEVCSIIATYDEPTTTYSLLFVRPSNHDLMTIMCVRSHFGKMSGRFREVANPALDVPQYLSALQRSKAESADSWGGVESYMTLHASSCRQVIPAAVAQVYKLLRGLITIGCLNGVVYLARLEQAAVAFCGMPDVVKSSKVPIKQLGAQFSVHIQSLLSLLRVCAQEVKIHVYLCAQ